MSRRRCVELDIADRVIPDHNLGFRYSSIWDSTRRTSASSSSESASSGAGRRKRSIATVRTCSVMTQPSPEPTGTRCSQPGRSTLVSGRTLTR